MTDLLCIGCGGVLQNTNPTAPFYTPKPIEEGAQTLCQRCFKMRHYGEVIPTSLNEEDYRKLIETIAIKDVLVVMVVDLFDLEGSLMSQIRRLVNDKDMLIIANKRDLLPKSVSDAKLKHNVLKFLHKEGLRPLDVLISSAVKKQGIDDILETIFHYAKKRDVYMVGTTNVGKSTLINAFLSATGATTESVITVHSSRGTTQGMIPIPFEGSTLYDTPGLFNKNHMARLLSTASYQKIQPKKEIKQSVFQLDAAQTIFLGGLCRIDHIQGNKASFVIFAAEGVKIHRRKLEDAEAFYERHRTGILSPPTEQDEPFILKPHRFITNVADKFDIVIPGLGFITIKGTKEIRVFTPEDVTPYKREALI